MTVDAFARGFNNAVFFFFFLLRISDVDRALVLIVVLICRLNMMQCVFALFLIII